MGEKLEDRWNAFDRSVRHPPTGAGWLVTSVITTSSADTLALKPGAEVTATIKATAVHIC